MKHSPIDTVRTQGNRAQALKSSLFYIWLALRPRFGSIIAIAESDTGKQTFEHHPPILSTALAITHPSVADKYTRCLQVQDIGVSTITKPLQDHISVGVVERLTSSIVYVK